MFIDSLKYSFGLDIADRSIKVAALEQFILQKKLITRLRSWGEQFLPVDTIVDGEIKKPEIFIQNLNNLLKHKAAKKIWTNIAVASIPEHKTFLKLVAYEGAIPKNHLSSVLKLIQTHIPEDPQNLTYDYQIMAHDHVVHILLGATFKTIANNYFETLQKAKILPLAFMPETVANCNSIIPWSTPPEEFNAILDIGLSHSSLVITRGLLPLLSLTIPFSGHHINTILAQKLNLSLTEAEQLSKRCGFDMKACEISLQKILSNIINELNEKIAQALGAMLNELKPKNKQKIKIQHLWLTGSGATLRKLDTVLSAELKMNVRIANPYINLGSVHAKSYPDNPVKYSTAIGLALINPKNVPKLNHD